MEILYSLWILIIILASGRSHQQVNEQRVDGCIDCHASLADNKIKHNDLEQSCDVCHQSNGEEHPSNGIIGFDLADEIPALCYYCHEEKTNLVYIHPPSEDGGCTNCHSPHSSNRNGLILDDYSENICLDCHDTGTMLSASIHGPVKEADCMGCHDPHQSDFQGITVNSIPELCLNCHDKIIESDGREVANIKKQLRIAKSIHAPVEMGECLTCHSPHLSDYSNLLIAQFPREQYIEGSEASFELCFYCHDSGLISEEETSTDTNFRNGTSNLHFLHINGEKGRNCTTCHDMHSSESSHLIRKNIVFGEWEMPMRFVDNDNGGSCYPGCHGEKTYQPGE